MIRTAVRTIAQSAVALAIILPTLLVADCAPAATPHDGQLDLRTDCGAKGDGKADDSLALKICLARLQAELNAGHPTVLHITAGLYRITGANGTMPTIKRRGGTIQGDGPHASYIILDPSYAGDLFSWSEAWIDGNIGPLTYDPARDMSGPTITGLQVTGSSAAKAQQNAFVFYDRDDNVLMRDIEINYLNGQCLSMGRTLRMPQAYVRESAFYNIKCWNAGTDYAPAISISSTSTPDSDATNELDFYKLAIFSARNDGLVIQTPTATGATRRIRFFGLRVEKTGGNGVTIGVQGDHGQVSSIEIYDLTAVNAGKAALLIGAGTQAPQPYHISVIGGSLGPGNLDGLDIEAGRLIDINLSSLDGPVKYGQRAGPNIHLYNDTTATPRSSLTSESDAKSR